MPKTLDVNSFKCFLIKELDESIFDINNFNKIIKFISFFLFILFFLLKITI